MCIALEWLWLARSTVRLPSLKACCGCIDIYHFTVFIFYADQGPLSRNFTRMAIVGFKTKSHQPGIGNGSYKCPGCRWRLR
jgi:hypothetical protein